MATSEGMIKYGAEVKVTCTFEILATNAARISDWVSNSATKAIDAMLNIRIGLTTGGTTGNDNTMYVYLYGSVDETYFDDNVTGTDAAITLRNPNNLKGPFAISFPTATGGPVAAVTIGSVASFFGGNMPKKWGFVIHNYTNVTAVASATNAAFCTASYVPITLLVSG